MCGQHQPIGEFAKGGRGYLTSYCTACQSQRNKKNSEQPSVAINRVVYNAKQLHIQKHGTDISLTTTKVQQLLADTGGADWFCPAITVSFKNKDSWRFTVIREDPTRSLGDDNVKIVSQEWRSSGHVEWTYALVQELKASVGRPADMEAFEAGLAPKVPPKHRKPACNDPTHIRKPYASGCRTCQLKSSNQSGSTGRRFLTRLLKLRKTKARHGGRVCEITIDNLIAQIRKQQGVCFYFDVPLVFSAQGGAFQASIERIDPSKDYTVDNICFICLGLNTFCNRKMKGMSGPGEQAQWSREKADLVKRGWGLPQAE
jgi:hypothetical protein